MVEPGRRLAGPLHKSLSGLLCSPLGHPPAGLHVSGHMEQQGSSLLTRERIGQKKKPWQETKECNLRGGMTRGRTPLTFMWEAALRLSARREEEEV